MFVRERERERVREREREREKKRKEERSLVDAFAMDTIPFARRVHQVTSDSQYIESQSGARANGRKRLQSKNCKLYLPKNEKQNFE